MSEEVEQTVHEVVLRIAGQRRGLTSVGNAQRLGADLGLGSLDLARLVAVLEIRLGVDPFGAEANLGDMRTVGDLCLAYRRARS
jgi:acyl carrier protein